MTRRIRSVMFKKDSIEITTEDKGDERETEFILRSTEEPDPAFAEAFNDLAGKLGEMLKLSPDWSDELVVTKVSYSLSKGTGIKGAVITCTCHVGCYDAPLTFNTPHQPFQPYKEGSNAAVMPEKIVEAVTHIETLATKYLKGERAQADMFLIRDGKKIAGDQGEEASAS